MSRTEYGANDRKRQQGLPVKGASLLPMTNHVRELQGYTSDARNKAEKLCGFPEAYSGAIEVLDQEAHVSFGKAAAYCLSRGSRLVLARVPKLAVIAACHALATQANDDQSLTWFGAFHYKLKVSGERKTKVWYVAPGRELEPFQGLVDKARLSKGTAAALAVAAVCFQVRAVHPGLREAMLRELQSFVAEVNERTVVAEAHAERIRALGEPVRPLYTLADAFGEEE